MGDRLSPGTDPLALRVITVMVVAGLIATGITAAVAGRPHADGSAPARPATVQAAAVKALTKAARACQAVTYQGVETVVWLGPHGTSTSVLDIWHQRDGQTLASPAPSHSASSGHAQVPATDSDLTPGLDGNGVLAMDSQLVSLLGTNYTLAVAGHGTVAGRSARIVTVRRGDGSLAAKFWLDSATSLPLRRQIFDTSAQVISDVVLVRLTFMHGPLPGAPKPRAKPWGDKLASTQLAGLRSRGWPLPGPLPGKLTLLSAEENTGSSGPVVDLDYSDGLSVVSIFVQRGHLPAQLNGWSPVALEGHLVYAHDPNDLSLTWSAHGFVYTVIAAAPEQTVDQVVAALPHSGAPGFLNRIKRGLSRMFSWVHP